MTSDDQGGIIAFLADPASYGLTGPVERMETHISMIFLVGDRVYKLKKALKLPYVDFSTPTIREDACRKEVALNSETAPDLYIGVRRITRSDAGTLEFDGEGPLVDAVVEMSRFEQNQLFDRIAVAGRLTPELMTQTARMIAYYHRRAPVVSKGGGAANIEAVLDINDAGFATSHVFDPEELARISGSFRSRLTRHGELLDRRALAGKVRRCHGDLHLRNICLLGGKPCLFDCIEFNLGIATIDVLYDLAFLLMDLWHRGFPDLANLVMNRYLDETDDEDGFCLLPFLMAIRAAVRAHVTATQAEEPGQDAARLAGEARSYFNLAHALLGDTPPRLIAIGGLSGSGKTTVADHLAAKVGAPPGARIVESDRIRKALHGVSAETRLPVSAYQPDISKKVYREMARHAELILAEGGSVVADAVFDDPANRLLMENAAARCGAGFQGIWLEADPELLRQRVRERAGGPSDATTDVLSGQLARKPADISWRHVDASGTPDTITAAILSN
ncbi:aminoglycoside phosphotransferase family enzyme/predicted kinase [Neorhizobium galegae]|uniref:bifunctional aminoglycoside phosphotransferase/ATP-binding protein n=1 Tax=Neorhizobium galegae TaxID=399 RepID=UPI00278130A8|nr:bifunctional aminoglycoside phosphotransferase/ATP-binding protein [Neorhizobium galegae]MDQ0132886.1 aminoglycoside phosphotransferase family enzyme/predicted kinase [Neorhizobium galegae]